MNLREFGGLKMLLFLLVITGAYSKPSDSYLVETEDGEKYIMTMDTQKNSTQLSTKIRKNETKSMLQNTVLPRTDHTKNARLSNGKNQVEVPLKIQPAATIKNATKLQLSNDVNKTEVNPKTQAPEADNKTNAVLQNNVLPKINNTTNATLSNGKNKVEEPQKNQPAAATIEIEKEGKGLAEEEVGDDYMQHTTNATLSNGKNKTEDPLKKPTINSNYKFNKASVIKC